MEEQETVIETGPELHKHDLMELFETLSPWEKARRTVRGLKQPKDTGEYKWAKLQVIRLSAPLAAVVVPVLAAVALTIMAAVAPSAQRTVRVQIMEPEQAPDLEKVEEIREQPPDIQDIDYKPDVTFNDNVAPSPTPPREFSPQPAEFDSVAMVKSPVVMRGIYGSRSPGVRGEAMRRYGAPPGVEDAVLRALRWLKKNQDPEGSWGKHKPAVTAMCLLAFLAHGEMPAQGEFGATVEKAVHWLIAQQAADGGYPRSYQHAIVTYALSETYALTKVPQVRDSAEKALAILIAGQNETGGFDYGLNAQPANKPARDDTSVMGWCAQALKAAKMAGLKHDGLEECIEKAILGFEKNAHPDGGFGYTAPGRTGLTGVGVLCMQLLGAANRPACTKGLAALADTTFFWDEKAPNAKFNRNYYWYYITQAKFHAGGDTWKAWNALFAPTLVEHQTIIPKDIEGPDGKMKDTGWWDMSQNISGSTDGPVMNTALACLQLEVYYRYLPTFMTPEVTEDAGTGAIDAQDGAGDVVDIEISI